VSEGDDLALVTVSGLDRAGAVPLRWGRVEDLRLGAQLTVVGYPSVVGLTVTQGIFSGMKRVASTDLVQTDAAVNPGNSGGPVLTSLGELVAIAVFTIRGTTGLNFGVAATTARAFAESGIVTSSAPPVDVRATAAYVVLDFYSYLQRRDYYSAWSMLSEPWRARQGYPDFAGGYRTTLSTQFDPVSTTVLSPASARVLGTVTALDVLPETPAGFAERTVFSGSYTVDHAAGRWGILEADMRRLSVVRVRR